MADFYGNYELSQLPTGLQIAESDDQQKYEEDPSEDNFKEDLLSSRSSPSVSELPKQAEYISISNATQKALWLKMVLVELDELKPDMTINIKCDNNGAVDLTENSTHHSRTKHIDVHHHFVREAVKNRQVLVLKESTEFMVPDVLRKALPRVNITDVQRRWDWCSILRAKRKCWRHAECNSNTIVSNKISVKGKRRKTRISKIFKAKVEKGKELNLEARPSDTGEWHLVSPSKAVSQRPAGTTDSERKVSFQQIP
ncbi:unnamed protein product [Nezara viridula]|uniref:Copia protein n=1 Tax=Nezara viridula TaxID=85310 RepID=A0A9P0H5A1_NEZVI|nr:unnamed protein product [Nezara viridula]